MRVKLRNAFCACCVTWLVLGAMCPWVHAQAVNKTFRAVDTERAWTDDNARAQKLLEQIKWEPVEFDVRCTSTPGPVYDALVRFDSPRPSGERWVDEVVMNWYAARDGAGNPVEAPAVLLVHSLHPRMIFANQIGHDFAKSGLHAFVIQLPGYGLRFSGDGRFPAVTTLERGPQAIADCLRARDAILALPNIRKGPIALQGTSLGGFVAATVGGIERSFDPVILLISGGDCYGTLMHGEHDARQLRITLEQHGHRGEALKKLLEPIEPLTVAHRLDPARTWMITALDDMTIPRASSDALVEAIGLPDDHRALLSTNHYTTLVMFPAITRHMAGIVRGEVGLTLDDEEAIAPQPNPPGASGDQGDGLTAPSSAGSR